MSASSPPTLVDLAEPIRLTLPDAGGVADVNLN